MLDPIQMAREALPKIEAALETMVWAPVNRPLPDGESFAGTNSEMTIMVVKVEYEDSTAYMAVAVMSPGTLIINIPPVLSVKIFKLAYAYYQRSIEN